MGEIAPTQPYKAGTPGMCAPSAEAVAWSRPACLQMLNVLFSENEVWFFGTDFSSAAEVVD